MISGPVWIAIPSPYDSFIHYSAPVYPGAHRICTELPEHTVLCRFPPFTSYFLFYSCRRSRDRLRSVEQEQAFDTEFTLASRTPLSLR